MKSLIAIAALCFSLATPVFAQEEERGGFLQTQLEDSLSGEGRIVRITGFKGALSSVATMEKLTIADSDGIWLIVEGASLNWERAALLRGRVIVREMTADRIEVVRKPIAVPSEAPAAEATEFSLPELPVSIDIKNVSVPEVKLGKDIVGRALELSLDASASLEGGSGQATFSAQRTDDADGEFTFSGGYARDTQALDVEFDFSEDAGGIVAQLLKIPDTPALEASITGHGPLADFTAEFFLASAGEKNIEGSVELIQTPFGVVGSEGATPQKSQGFKLKLGGDVTALFAPEYRSFFGPDLSLNLEGAREPSGALDLENFSLQAQTIDLKGGARLSPEMWPTLLNIKGNVKTKDGTPVLLPLSGSKTLVDSLNLNLSYDAHKGSGWQGSLGLVNLVRDEVELASARLSMAGEFESKVHKVTGVNANVTFATEGLVLADPALSQALGTTLKGRAYVAYKPQTPLVVHNVSVEGKGVAFSGDFDIGGLSDGLPTDLKAALTIDDLSQFAALAKQPIAGGANLSVSGSVEALSGIFDVIIEGETQDLAVGISQADPLIAGVGNIYLDAARDSEGTTLRAFKITTPELSLDAHADVDADDGTFVYEAKLRDLALILPQYPGGVTLEGTANLSADGVVLDTSMTGPLGTTAKVSGLVTGPNANMSIQAHLDDLGAIVAALPGSVDLDGTLKKQGADWHVSTNVNGSMGISAKAEGLVLEDQSLDMKVSGSAPLGLAGPFITPRTLSGTAQFDLAIKGVPSLNAVSGQVTISNSEVVAPNFQLALKDLGAQVTLNNSSVNIDAKANVSSGGSLTVQGGMSLVGGYEANLALALQAIQLSDPALYSTSVNGNVAVNGPLLGGALISGLIDIGVTEITVPAGSIASVTSIPQMDHIGASAAVRATLERAGLDKKTEKTGASGNSGGPVYPLDVTISAPRQIFIRGRGIDAELGGEIRLTGTTANIVSVGAFELQRGRINILERRFALTDGEILLEGSFDPRLNLRATTTIPDGEASIVVGGFLSEPEITFESSPEAPEDQVLALIFFGVPFDEMTAFQSLQLASAVATLTGRGGTGVIGRLRENLPVDDFELDSNSDGVATVSVGKHLSENVYSNVEVSAQGDTEISLNFDLTKKLTAKGTTGNDGNSSIGIFFNTDY
ncbi:translocation/assembly module TamB domain-containing protein [Falsihalocynthiibacter sp. S25ZX9]|uniref:translocation/assembly module TamB domain-containing protein n=1 Tax=Falsihalocynthiibacter sp. S25ZX9 TaxID=3240870 RepID=UPI0035108A6D